MSTDLIICGTVGLLLVIPCVAWAAEAADRHITKRRCARKMRERQRQARASWERTLQRLQVESAERLGARGKAVGAQRQALAA